MKRHIKKNLFFVIPILFAFYLSHAQDAALNEIPGINTTNMDKLVTPNNDFYRFVNGAWLDKTVIPADKTSWGSGEELYEKTNKNVMVILKDAAKNPKYKSNTDQGKAINLFNAVMDTVARDRQGMTPIKTSLANIDAIKNIQDLQKVMIEMEPAGGIGFVSVNIGADKMNSNNNSVSISPGKLGLPDKDYYVSDDAGSKEKREKYVLHLGKMLQFLGESAGQAKKEANNILQLEIKMAAMRLDRVERRDSKKQYNPMTVAELQKLTPAIDWNAYFTGLGFSKLNNVIVNQPKYMAALQTILAENKIDDWKAYMRWTLLNQTAGQLSNTIGNANFDFYGKTLNGTLKRRPLEERALYTVNGSIGEALGKLYVEKMFPPEAKLKAENMIRNLIVAYKARINNLSWMSPTTKLKAIEKLEKMTIKIGYPDKWKDYSGLDIKSIAEGGSYFATMRAISIWNFNKDRDKLNKPVDKTEWYMAPQEVNAYYNPPYNEIVFPAAILQPPFYDYKADDAINYGGIGAVIGHEISHGFDDSGAQYNAEGNLVNWWTEEDLKQFTALGNKLADQYSALEPFPGARVDGKFTLGENIGDLGGINAAYDGLQFYLKSNGSPGLIDGYTPEQRFFISWATIWRSKMREEALKNQLKTNPHSPSNYRGFVPLKNVDAFYKAFNIGQGDGMYLTPNERVKIW
ncbi:MAG: M13 family metallopeptidase [Burkholderiales bacterium]|nr:M13 family metallopeptidase [Flavobacterium sp.]